MVIRAAVVAVLRLGSGKLAAGRSRKLLIAARAGKRGQDPGKQLLARDGAVES